MCSCHQGSPCQTMRPYMFSCSLGQPSWSWSQGHHGYLCRMLISNGGLSINPYNLALMSWKKVCFLKFCSCQLMHLMSFVLSLTKAIKPACLGLLLFYFNMMLRIPTMNIFWHFLRNQFGRSDSDWGWEDLLSFLNLKLGRPEISVLTYRA